MSTNRIKHLVGDAGPQAEAIMRRVVSTPLAQEILGTYSKRRPDLGNTLMIAHRDSFVHRYFTRALLRSNPEVWQAEIEKQAEIMEGIGAPGLLVFPMPAWMLCTILHAVPADEGLRARWREQIESTAWTVALAQPGTLAVSPLGHVDEGATK